ncbi:MAG TPA: cytochrome c oxidase subunit 2A [Bacillota bacterium]|nr:cytochrome c oxidase subunit 2A [Bacillota bacterium]
MTQAPIREPETKGKKDEEENEFKGTFIAVMLLGLFLIASWVGVWILFLVR